jgi:hypothetical protein
MQGEILVSMPTPDLVAGEASLRDAVHLARAQGARGWELRAATGLARVQVERGEPRKGYELLAPVYGWFTEGFDTSDLREAKALLQELASAPLPDGGDRNVLPAASRVESRTGAVAWAKLASPRFPSPLIKPDVRVSRIRLSDWLHLEAHGRAPTWTWRSRSTPSSPNTTPSG